MGVVTGQRIEVEECRLITSVGLTVPFPRRVLYVCGYGIPGIPAESINDKWLLFAKDYGKYHLCSPGTVQCHELRDLGLRCAPYRRRRTRSVLGAAME